MEWSSWLHTDQSWRDHCRMKRKRAKKDHARKKRARKQKQHLKCIKSKEGIRRIVLGSRHIEVK
jgi:hypothetical protein